MNEQPSPLSPELVQEFVAKAHGDLDAVREFLASEPALVNAAWDWGGGDWETGLGAAAHMGRRDIALFLLDHGARIDVFAAAMLGETEVVRAMLTVWPELRDARGPHGIPLLEHAKAGGEQARTVLDFLEAPQEAPAR
ncbi:MAG: ankyrin repeat domain-containing protein [Actinomycetota bacterium]|nr:ankyrin repeat domain-containing protein [Actinomycetota bacterium]